MKLLLLHGPATNSSRSRLLQLKKACDPNDITVFDSKATLQEVLGSLATLPLLSSQRMMIWENPSESLILPKISGDEGLILIIWLDKELKEGKPLIQSVKELKGEVLFFAEGKEISIFPFLDLLGARDKKAFVKWQQHKQAEGTVVDDQYLITMILYLLRSLIAPSQKAPVFVKEKLARQRVKFSKEELVNLYNLVLDADFKIKMGLLDPLQAEFLLISRFVGINSI